MIYKPDYNYIPPVTWPILTPLFDFFCILGGLGPRFRAKVLSAAKLRDGIAVADIGCGTGVLLNAVKQKFPNIRCIGLDPDRKALGIAERRLAKAQLSVELKEAFAEALPLPDQSVDICFSTLALHHMPDESKRTATKEMYRVLKSGGTVVIADLGPTKSTLFPRLLFFEKIEYLEGNFKGVIPRYLKEVGFKNIQVADRHFPNIHIVVAEKSA